MKKGVKKQMAAVALSLLTVSGIGLSGANVVKAASPLKNKATINITAKKVRKAVTKTSSCSIKKGKSIWVGPSYGGVHPSTTNWKSSNSSIATVATKGDSEGGHKVTAKKKGKVTISCIVSKTSGHWVKGDVFKWETVSSFV